MFEEAIQYDRFPSEIIADEYLQGDTRDGSLYIFHDDNQTGTILEVAKKAFLRCGYNVLNTNQFKIDNRQNILDTIDKITNEDHSHRSSFILLFLGTIKDKNEVYHTTSGDTIHGAEIWRKVMTCKTLKYRPKIFIFHGFKKVSFEQIDARRYIPEPIEPIRYDIPVESDMLIVYKVTEGITADSSYLRNLWSNIIDYGSRDDLVNIISYTERHITDDRYPITVSTLRKKFYVTPSEFRLQWYDFNKNADEMLITIAHIQDKVSNLKCQTNHMRPASRASSTTTESNDRRKKIGKFDYSHIKAKVDSFRNK